MIGAVPRRASLLSEGQTQAVSSAVETSLTNGALIRAPRSFRTARQPADSKASQMAATNPFGEPPLSPGKYQLKSLRDWGGRSTWPRPTRGGCR